MMPRETGLYLYYPVFATFKYKYKEWGFYCVVSYLVI